MRVSQWMSQPAITCKSTDSVNEAARMMWEHDCGAIPVVDGEGRVVGIVTDRDVCMAAYTQGERLWAIPVTTAMAKEVACCRPDDSVEAAQSVMSEKRVHRLPVVDADGRPVGVLSFNDVAREMASSCDIGGAAQREFAKTAQAICRTRDSGVRPAGSSAVVATADR